MVDKYEGSKPRVKRGFAAMSPERQREIAALGGRAAHKSGHAHEFTSEEARLAGKKRHLPRSPLTEVGATHSPSGGATVKLLATSGE